MVYFQNKNLNLGKFWRALEWKMLAFLWSFGIIYGHLVYLYFMDSWYTLWSIGIFCLFWYIVGYLHKTGYPDYNAGVVYMLQFF
jgi:hypothetical protein